MSGFTTTNTKHLAPPALAERWGFHVGTLANMRVEGRGPAYLKLGGRIVYRLDDIETYEEHALVDSGAAA